MTPTDEGGVVDAYDDIITPIQLQSYLANIMNNNSVPIATLQLF